MLFRRKEPVHLTPLQQGLKKAVSLNFYDLTTLQLESVRRLRSIGLLKINMDGSISPTEAGRGIIDGTIETNETVPSFIAGLYNECASKPKSSPPAKETKRFFRRKTPPVEVHLTPLQRGLKTAASLSYFDLNPIQEKSVDRMRNIGLLRLHMDGSIVPTKMGKDIIDGTIETNENVPPFIAGLI